MRPCSILVTALGGALVPILDLWLRSESPTWAVAISAALLGASVGIFLGIVAAAPAHADLAATLLLVPIAIIGAGQVYGVAQRAAELVPLLGEVALWALALALALPISRGILFIGTLRARSGVIRGALTFAAGLATVVFVVDALWYRREMIAGVLTFLCVLGSLVAACRHRPGPGLALLATLLGVAAYQLLPELYPSLRELALVLALGGGALGIRTLLLDSTLPAMSSKGWRWTGLFFLLSCLMGWGAHALVRQESSAVGELTSRPGVFTDLISLLAGWTDLDGDHVGGVFLDDDCAPLDASAHPGAHEEPGNLIDDDCLFGDADLSEARRWVRRVDAVNPRPPAFRSDIVVVLIDALRHDVIDQMSLPTLESLRRRGTTFSRVYSSAPMTSAALPGHLAGRLPSTLTMEWRSTFAATPTRPPRLLMDALEEGGYTTIIAGHVAGGHPYFGPDPKRHGFDEVASVPKTSSDSELIGEAVAAFEGHGSAVPRFMWVHTMAVHGQPDLTTYRRALRDFDEALAALVTSLPDDAIVIVTSDHGEEMGEHGGRHHASSLYDEQVRVPLIFAHPDGRGEVVEALTTTRFIAPTLVAMVSPDRAPDGYGPYLCLRPEACNDAEVPLQFEMSARHLHGLVLGHRKVIHDLRAGTFRAYDLRNDPGERSPLKSTPPDMIEAPQRWESFAFGRANPSLYWPYR